ncbi:hypothetical protein GCM10023340_26500 [Nocardioides marinquilinus]|uniref:Uncharacterized protein n=1 Tax=Nocardioides marinquilinus TaxID=1210400 RepID=A0ABP9PPL4_9ACTN
MDSEQPWNHRLSDVAETAGGLAQMARRVERGEIDPSFFVHLKTASLLDAFADALEVPGAPGRGTGSKSS